MKKFLAAVWFVLLACTAHAEEIKLNVGAGLAHHFPTTPDGTWIQKGFEHDFDVDSLTYKAGLEYGMTNSLSLNAGYVQLGNTYSSSFAVPDARYDTNTHTCTSNCSNVRTFNVKDKMSGPELYLTYKWKGEHISPFITFGGAYMFHQLNGSADNQISSIKFEYDGNIVMARTGAGVCYKYLCVDTTYYHGFTGQDECRFPLSQRVLTTTMFLSIPIY